MPERRRAPRATPARAERGAASRRTVAPAATTRGAATRRTARAQRPAPVRILFLDADGTLTDGVVGFDTAGDFRHFHVRDGLALTWARDLGILPVVISGRASQAVALRMRDLELEHYLGIQDKVAVAATVLAREGASWEQCAMIGDDLPDVPLMRRVGWPIAVADAVAEVRALARTVTRTAAGHGAVREAAEMLLRHNGVWDQVLERYEVPR